MTTAPEPHSFIPRLVTDPRTAAQSADWMTCQVCGREFGHWVHRTQHYKKHHPTVDPKSDTPGKDLRSDQKAARRVLAEDYYRCEDCGRKFDEGPDGMPSSLKEGPDGGFLCSKCLAKQSSRTAGRADASLVALLRDYLSQPGRMNSFIDEVVFADAYGYQIEAVYDDFTAYLRDRGTQADESAVNEAIITVAVDVDDEVTTSVEQGRTKPQKSWDPQIDFVRDGGRATGPNGGQIPVCDVCGRSGRDVQFPMLPKSGPKFGDICDVCDDKAMKDRKGSARTAARSIREIAAEVDEDWAKVYFGARPYLDAMYSLDSINDNYFLDSGASIVSYFLGNAATWRGETAKRVKAELKAMLKEVYGSRTAAGNNDADGIIAMWDATSEPGDDLDDFIAFVLSQTDDEAIRAKALQTVMDRGHRRLGPWGDRDKSGNRTAMADSTQKAFTQALEAEVEKRGYSLRIDYSYSNRARVYATDGLDPVGPRLALEVDGGRIDFYGPDQNVRPAKPLAWHQIGSDKTEYGAAGSLTELVQQVADILCGNGKKSSRTASRWDWGTWTVEGHRQKQPTSTTNREGGNMDARRRAEARRRAARRRLAELTQETSPANAVAPYGESVERTETPAAEAPVATTEETMTPAATEDVENLDASVVSGDPGQSEVTVARRRARARARARAAALRRAAMRRRAFEGAEAEVTKRRDSEAQIDGDTIPSGGYAGENPGTQVGPYDPAQRDEAIALARRAARARARHLAVSRARTAKGEWKTCEICGADFENWFHRAGHFKKNHPGVDPKAKKDEAKASAFRRRAEDTTDVTDLDAPVPVSTEPAATIDLTAPTAEPDQLALADKPSDVNDGSEAIALPEDRPQPENPFNDVAPYTASRDDRARVLRVAAFVDERIELGFTAKAEKYAEIARFETMSDGVLAGYIAATEEFKKAAKRSDAGASRFPVRRSASRTPSLGAASTPSAGFGEDPSTDYLALL